MNFTIQPLHNYVLIKVLTENKTSGGLHLPDGSKIDKGIRVEGVGKECKVVKPGDFVILGGVVRKIKNEDGRETEFALVLETDCLAIKKFK